MDGVTKRGDIRSRTAEENAHWDWSWLNGSFGHTKISPSDIDALVERQGRFLIFETKSLGDNPSEGQWILLKTLARLPDFTVYVLWGKRSWPERMQRIYGTRLGPVESASREKVQEEVARWFEWAEEHPKAGKV
jgi:hypothetical protein